MKTEDVVIIGAGPAGIATAIQLKRYDIEPVLIEQKEVGGLLRNANLVENYPGFPAGISGLELVKLFKRQLKSAGVKVSSEKALQVEHQNGLFFTRTSRRVIRSFIVVVATGTTPRELPIPPMSERVRDRVLYEICPILGIRGKKVAIIGAGDAAFDYALSLSRENQVVILNRGNDSPCVPVLRQRSAESENISYLPNVCVEEMDDEQSRVSLTCTHNYSEEKSRILADYVIGAIGRSPCLDVLGCDLRREHGPFANARELYLVGDVRNGACRQTAICVGDGVRAAMEIQRSLEEDRE